MSKDICVVLGKAVWSNATNKDAIKSTFMMPDVKFLLTLSELLNRLYILSIQLLCM